MAARDVQPARWEKLYFAKDASQEPCTIDWVLMAGLESGRPCRLLDSSLGSYNLDLQTVAQADVRSIQTNIVSPPPRAPRYHHGGRGSSPQGSGRWRADWDITPPPVPHEVSSRREGLEFQRARRVEGEPA